jgi:hypothetical protein
MSLNVICLDDSNKPNEISINHRVKKDEKYTVVKLVTSKLTKERYFVLEEIKPDNSLYGGYNINRFGIPVDLDVLVENEELTEEMV